ncbi:MAG: zinc ribbon domain-containing protein [Acidobacteria bacterium]|nr:zinc ribbon domain-containing protein [Acidobacteriota bacterium]
MYCPQCGQQQASSEMRFCSRCGFPLGGVVELLAGGGVLQSVGGEELREQALSPRRRGVRQGVVMMLLGTVIVPVLGILNAHQEQTTMLEILVAISAVIFFAGGLMRILYALLFESATPGSRGDSLTDVLPVSPAALNAGARISALPPAQSIPVSEFTSRRMNTAELMHPPSVTENTTRLLDEEKSTRGE